ncbi:MAG: NTP transferase domain-containing protein [Sphingomicrobium sp.]
MTPTAIVLAGQRPGVDPLAAHFGATMKALIPLAGEPMVVRPVRALLASPGVERILVLAQQRERLAEAIGALDRVEVRESRGTIAETILALCADPATPWPLLVTTADHALLNPAMIAEFLGAAASADIAIGVVEKSRLERRLPQTKRTWIALGGESVTGANLFWLASAKVAPAVELWRSVEQDRKKAWRLIALLGPFMLAMAATRMIGLDDLAARLGLKLGLRVRAVRLSDPLAGVDIDSLADHALVEAIIAGRA